MKRVLPFLAVLLLLAPAKALAETTPPGTTSSTTLQPVIPAPLVVVSCKFTDNGAAGWETVDVYMQPATGGTVYLDATIAAGDNGAIVDQTSYVPGQPMGAERKPVITQATDAAEWQFTFSNQVAGTAVVTINAVMYDPAGFPLPPITGHQFQADIGCKLPANSLAGQLSVSSFPITPTPASPVIPVPTMPVDTATPPALVPPVTPAVPASIPTVPPVLVGPPMHQLKLGQTATFTVVVIPGASSTRVTLALNGLLLFVSSSREWLRGPVWIIPAAANGRSAAGQRFTLNLKALKRGHACLSVDSLPKDGDDSPSNRVCINVVP